jgi:hypothetical protein
MPAPSGNPHGPRLWLERDCNMQVLGESEFAREPVLANCAFFTCVQCGFCGYLILGGSAKQLLDEGERHAIECKATHRLIGAGSQRTHGQKRRVLRSAGGKRWIAALLIAIARWLRMPAMLNSPGDRRTFRQIWSHGNGLCNAIRPRTDVTHEHFSEELRDCSSA